MRTLAHSGAIIDQLKALKQYTSIFFLKKGQWQNIAQSTGLVVVRTMETQSMHVLSISRSVTDEVYKLWLIMPEETRNRLFTQERVTRQIFYLCLIANVFK